MNNMELYIAIAIMTSVNFLTRLIPFLFFTKKDLPNSLEFVGKFFPAVIMTILIFYSIREINFLSFPYGIKEIGAIIFTAILHLSLKNYLISIFLGTLFYMALIQFL